MIKKMIDMHCHILPGVDDGAQTRKDVQTLLQMEYDDGVRTLVLTPHYRKEMFEPDKRLVKQRFEYIKKEIAQMGLDMEVFLGCEYHANADMIKDLKLNPHFRINGSLYVLVEFSGLHAYRSIREWIYQLIISGFRPIVAHVERYPEVMKDIKRVKELIDMGAYMQVSSSAVTGEDGLITKLQVKGLLKKGLVHFVGSDAHNATDRAPNMKKCAEYIAKKIDYAYAKNIFVNNPRKILGYKD